MTEYVIMAIILTAGLALALVRLSLKTLVRTSVKETVKDEFKTHRLEIQHDFDLQRQSIDHQFEERWNYLNRQEKFQLAALDKRMEAHQRAFALGRKMFLSLHSQSDVTVTISRECEDFWDSYSLFLTEDARRAFRTALHNFTSYEVYYHAWKLDTKNPERTTNLERVFESIQKLPEALIVIVDREASGKLDYLRDDAITPFEVKPRHGSCND